MHKSLTHSFTSLSHSNLQHRVFLLGGFVIMALSTYFNNCDTLQIPNFETNTFPEAMPEVAEPNLQHLFSYSSDESFFLSNALLENYLDAGFHIPQENNPLCDPFISHSRHDDMLPTREDYNLLPFHKRKRCCYEEQHHQHSSLHEFITPTMPSNILDGFAVPYENCCSLQAEELLQQLPQHGSTCVDLQCEKKDVKRTISPQSIAARERRRKITEKTLELGKLIPGGPKMNTAEMLNAAAKYVKYLQVQVGMLELENTLKEDEAAPPSETLHTLVVSPFVQEKLYMEERCFVPKETVITLTNHEDVQSRPTILEDLKQLIETDIEKKEKPE